MREARLLERIRMRAKMPDRSMTEDPKKVVDSVMAHLQNVLNTRQGGVQIAEDYGLPDFNDVLHSQAGAPREIEKSIRQTIQKYEPRLRAVRVRYIPIEDDLLSLNFEIHARLAFDNAEEAIVFESQLGQDGKITIRR
ncbi:MAG: type VI secretion system baseplate subunit TssE [Desulfosalsimonadaceae bacterium]